MGTASKPDNIFFISAEDRTSFILELSRELVSLEMPAGANKPNQVVACKSGISSFDRRRNVRKQQTSPQIGHRKSAHPAGLNVFRHERDHLECHLNAATKQVGDPADGTLVWHMHDVGAGHLFKHFCEQMGRRSVSSGRVVDLAGIGFGIVNQLLIEWTGNAGLIAKS